MSSRLSSERHACKTFSNITGSTCISYKVAHRSSWRICNKLLCLSLHCEQEYRRAPGMSSAEAAARRRLGALRAHVDPALPQSCGPTQSDVENASCGVGQQQTSGHAPPEATQSSYERIHGQVSQSPADWRSISSVAREELQEVEYHKAEGDGIARVSLCQCQTCCCTRAW